MKYNVQIKAGENQWKEQDKINAACESLVASIG